jgi:hypothetical protein
VTAAGLDCITQLMDSPLLIGSNVSNGLVDRLSHDTMAPVLANQRTAVTCIIPDEQTFEISI